MNGERGECEHDGIRFTDVLTTATAIADYQGEALVRPDHVIGAIDVLTDVVTMADFGRPVSPLVRRAQQPGVDAPVRDLVQRWFDRLGGDVSATLDAQQMELLRADVEALGDFS